MTAASRSQAGIGLALAVVSAASFGLSGPLARGLLDAGWTAGAVVLARLAIARAGRRADRRARAARPVERAAGERVVRARCSAPCPVAGAQFAYFSAVRADGRRPGAVDRVHGARRRGRLALAAPRRASRAADGRRCRPRRARSRARPRPPVGRRPRAGRRALGAARDGLRRLVLRARREAAPGPAAGRAGRRRPGERGAGARRARRRGHPPDARDDRLAGLRGQRPSAGGCRCSGSASSRPGSPTAPGSPPAAGSARACPRSSPCSRSSPA